MATSFARNSREIEIEILPPVLSPTDGRLIVVDGDYVGIPKAVLTAAFLEARERFFHNRGEGDPNPNETLEATAIILLFDPEHITAANYRKRVLLAAAANQNDPNLHGIMNAVWRELVFLNAIQASPLHRQTKCPTLWQHRLWMFTTIVPRVAMTGIKGIAGGGSLLVRSELANILRAAERHPTNYYAWQHARRLFTSKYMDVALRHDFDRSNWSVFCDQIANWCLGHPSDTSAWSFLLWMLSSEECDGITRSWILSKVLDFVERLDWKQEALWNFLRTAIVIDPMANKAQLEARFSDKYVGWTSPTSRMPWSATSLHTGTSFGI